MVGVDMVSLKVEKNKRGEGERTLPHHAIPDQYHLAVGLQGHGIEADNK